LEKSVTHLEQQALVQEQKMKNSVVDPVELAKAEEKVKVLKKGA
jgi:hypothetical protein